MSSDVPPAAEPQHSDVPTSDVPSDAKMWAMFCHLSAILTMYLLAMGFLGPLIIWLIKKDRSKFVDYHGKEALNFQITVLIACLICIPLIFVIIGIFLLIALGIFSLVMCIIAGINANGGGYYRYPLTLRLIK
jgi:uncharacterized Tic20 family protein